MQNQSVQVHELFASLPYTYYKWTMEQCPVWQNVHTRVYVQRMHSDHLYEHVRTSMRYVLEYGVYAMKGLWVYQRCGQHPLPGKSLLVHHRSRQFFLGGRLASDFVWR